MTGALPVIFFWGGEDDIQVYTNWRSFSSISALSSQQDNGTSYIFKLTAEECLKSQIATSSWGGSRKLPYAFTENGIAMLSSVLRSETAIAVNIKIMRTFTQIRKSVYRESNLLTRVELIEYNILTALRS